MPTTPLAAALAGSGESPISVASTPIYRFSADAEAAFQAYVTARQKPPHFANARSVRNALDRSRLRQANRIFAGRAARLTRADLMTIEAEDIMASRVFEEARLAGDGTQGPVNG